VRTTLRAHVGHLAARALLAGAVLVVPLACGGRAAAPGAQPSTEAARRAGQRSNDAEEVGRWALYELVAKGGDTAKAREARARLDKLPGDGMYASLARAIADGGHGHIDAAAKSYLAVVRAARNSRDPRAPMVAWFATNHLLGMSPNVAGLWEKAAPIVEDAIAHPGSIGWRARGELVSWWTQQAFEAAKSGVLDTSAERHGCLRNVRLSGPFGHDATSDRRQAFEAERPGPWPRTFPAHPSVHLRPHVLPTERHGCQIRSTEPTPGGIFYAESFVDLPAEREVIVAAQGAFRLSVDDTIVLDRDTRVWGIWGKFTVHLRLRAGRHRLLARIGGPETSMRLMQPDGTPLALASSDDPRPVYTSTPPVVLADPNVLDRFVRDGKPLPVEDDLGRYLASFLAHVEEEDDVASVILEPLVSDPSAATPFAQALAAVFAEKDPIFPDADRHDLARDLRQRAIAKDAELWWPRFWLALDEAEKKGLPDAVEEVRKLADHFRDVPEIPEGLAQLYAKLNWTAERSVTLKDLATRFPRNARVLQEVLEVLEDEGRHLEADRIAARIRTLDPDSEIEVDRALSRHDYGAAIAELKRLGQRRPDRKDIADRIVEATMRSGDSSGVLSLLERLVAKKPRDSGLRLALADAKFASGDKLALRHGIADAILAGGSTGELSEAVDLVEGTTELEPYRLDGAKIVRDYETSGGEMEGTAARILDYSSVWIHPDGSSRMLEHELIRIQSQEAIGKMAEQRVPDGLLLRMRVIKKDGTLLEPEFVEGKKTVTMPHLEIGDYIETENITSRGGDGQLGRRYLGPHWFFREADVGYWRSEFVVISPKDKPLVVETRGEVPPPSLREDGPLVVRRWRVDRSPAAPDEPASAPIQEFLPSVRIGWGISLSDHLRRLTDAANDELPRDPRLVRIAAQIVGNESNDSAKARKLYRWLLANVEDGRESDGRRVVVGKSGNRASAFMYLCRTLGIPVELAASKDKLNPPPLGPISEAEQYDDFVIRVGGKTPEWLTLRDKFAPYGYLPAGLRGQPAYRLIAGAPRETTSVAGTADGILYEGTGDLRSDGSAVLELAQKFLGQPGMGLRAGLEQLPPAQLHDAIEGKLLAQAIPGARLGKIAIENQADLDQPIVLRMSVEVSDFMRRRGRDLVLVPPFAIRLSQIARLPRRQTPLVLGEPTYTSIHLTFKLPPGARVVTSLTPVEVKDHDRRVIVRDRLEGQNLVLDRVIDIPAGRIEPAAYAELQNFVRRADEATMRDIVIAVGK
jgi:tetratricopeptide (TPR) repeat protein